MPWHRKWQLILAWEIPWTDEPGGLVHGVAMGWTRLNTVAGLPKLVQHD